MKDDQGRPKLGSTALDLGIRPGRDIEVDHNGMVHRPAYRPGEKNGLSCASAIDQLPFFARPVKFGGGNTKTEVWKIRRTDLGSEIEARKDGGFHISIGPTTTMPLADYVAAIEQTVSRWVKVT